jgi:hypothetical protein
MRPVYQTFAMAAADDDAICVSQTLGGAGSLTIDGTLAATVADLTQDPSSTRTAAVLDTPRHVGITSAGDDRTVTFTVTGLDRYGRPLTEALLGANAGLATTLNNFSRVFTVSASAATTVKVGTTNTADLPWVPLDIYRHPFELGITGGVPSGASFTWGVETTLDNPEVAGFTEGSATKTTHATLTGKTTTTNGSQTIPCRLIRAKLTGYTSGTFSFQVLQS